MRIVTDYKPKPTPDRRSDWEAYDVDTPGCPDPIVGYGPTAQEAISNLLDEIRNK